MPEQPLKPCVVCGGECAGKPRIKDAHGRYMHQACAKAAKGERARGGSGPKPAHAAVPSAEGMMDYLIEGAMESAPEPCENCGRGRPKNAIICVHCGFNPATGKAVKTRIEKQLKDPDEPKARRSSGGLPIAVSPVSAAIFGVFVFGGLAALGLAVDPMFFWVYILAWSFFSFTSWVWSIVSAFQDGELGWGITLIVGPIFCIGWLLNYYYVWVESGRDNLKACYAVSLVAGIAMWVIIQFSMWAAMGATMGTVTGPTPETLAALAAAEDATGELAPPGVTLYESASPKQRADLLLLDLASDIQFSRSGSGVPLTRNEERIFDQQEIELEDYPTWVLIMARENWELMSREERDAYRSRIFWFDYIPEEGSTALEEDFSSADQTTTVIHWVGRAAVDEARPGEHPIAVNAMVMAFVYGDWDEETDRFLGSGAGRTRDLEELADRGVQRARDKIAALSDENRERMLHYVMTGWWPEDDPDFGFAFQPPSRYSSDGTLEYAVGTSRNDEDLAAALAERGVSDLRELNRTNAWKPGALSALIGAPPTPSFQPTPYASGSARPGEDLEMVERALLQGSHWYLKAQTDLDNAFETLQASTTISDYRPEVRDAVIAIFDQLDENDRSALLNYVATGGVLTNAEDIEAAFAP